MAAAERTTGLDAGLAGRRVLVTAGAAGIGLAIVERLLVHGARVFVCDVAEAVLDSFAKANPQAGCNQGRRIERSGRRSHVCGGAR